MNVILAIVEVLICILELIIIIKLNRYTKQHENEPMELHKSYIFPRFIVIAIIPIVVAVLNLIALFI